mgnify:CR=1 FL=1
MHSRKKGKAGSKKPVRKTKPSWLIYKPKEIELLVLKFYKEGKTPSQIGMVLRDSYGIPDIKTIIKKSINQILNENKQLAQVPEDLMALIRKSVTIRKHLEPNRKDMAAKHGLQMTDSKIRRLEKYYKRTKRLPASWKYNPESVRLLTE